MPGIVTSLRLSLGSEALGFALLGPFFFKTSRLLLALVPESTLRDSFLIVDGGRVCQEQADITLHPSFFHTLRKSGQASTPISFLIF